MFRINRITLIFFLIALGWIGLIAYVCQQERASERGLVVQLALAEARGSFNKDLVYRRWVAKQGGVYVKPSPFSPPNPYLSHIPDRDLTTTDGQQLTLINPAYMTRQVHDLAQTQYGAKGHITSLNPLRPENAPDPWERESLEQFRQGVRETSIQTTINGEPYLRLMLPMVTEEMCLKCHGHQGYRIGDIRGGISVSVPLAGYFSAQSENMSQESTNKMLLLGVGLLLLLLCYVAVQKFLGSEKRISQVVERSEEKYRVVFDESTVGLALADAETGHIVDCNRALLSLAERTREEVVGQPQAILHSRVTKPGAVTDEFVIHRDEEPGSLLETTLLTSAGEKIPVEIKAQPVWIDNRKMMLGIFRDLSEQKESERQLIKNEKMLRAVLNSQYDAVFLYRTSGGTFTPFEMVNDIALERYGYTRETFLTLTPEDITENRQNAHDLWNGISDDVAETRKINVVMTHRRKSGETFPVEVSSTRLELDGTEYLLSVARDISERVSHHQEKQELLEKLQYISSQIPGMVYQFERSAGGEYSIPFTSGTILSLFELSPEDVQQSAESLIRKIHPDDLPATLQSIELSGDQLSPWRHEFRAIMNDGNIIWLEGNSIPRQQDDGRIVWYGYITDISQRKTEENRQRDILQQLRQREKLNVVGMLASGIAHNFNNHLAIILGNIDLAKRQELGQADRDELLENAQLAAKRATDLVRQLMRFNRSDERVNTCFALCELLVETGRLLKSTLPSSINKTLQLPADCSGLTVMGSPSRIQDLLLNLCTNAVHAMNDRGTLTLALEKATFTDPAMPPPDEIAYGDYACLSVSDTGCGFDDETKSKIFEPFFTTKEAGRGTGLGLATVKNTVDEYGGAITVDSVPGQGTTFKIYLPLCPAEGEELSCSDQAVVSGTERILLVDDDLMMAELGADILQSIGYQVVLETDSRAALETFQQAPESFDVILTDQVMPALTGIELAQQVKKIRPDIPIVLVTGYSLDVTEETMGQYGICYMCHKPFDIAEISVAIRKALAAG